MPIDLEMLLSASNHTYYPHSHFESANYADSVYNRSLSFHQNHCIPQCLGKHQGLFYKKSVHNAFISNVPYNSLNSAASKQELCYGPRKKKVSFADDRGLKLVEVREIPKAPKWADDVITLLIGSARRSVVKEKKWRIAFEHPPWPDEKLVEVLDKNMAALEYVSVKEGTDDILFGTVKVKNLSYEKSVFIRATFDRWLSYVDIPCGYMKPSEKRMKPNMYDTFCFNTKISHVASRYEVIEFCVCFQCNGKEYWDNNGGINYRLVVEYPKSNAAEMQQTNVPKASDKAAQKYIILTDNENADEMDIWSKIMYNEPYW